MNSVFPFFQWFTFIKINTIQNLLNFYQTDGYIHTRLVYRITVKREGKKTNVLFYFLWIINFRVFSLFFVSCFNVGTCSDLSTFFPDVDSVSFSFFRIDRFWWVYDSKVDECDEYEEIVVNAEHIERGCFKRNIQKY